MRSLMRPLLALTASVVLTVPLVVAQPAQAATYSPLSERGLALSSLGAGDVPRWMSRGSTPEAKQSFRTGSLASAPPVCMDQTGNFTEAKRARQSMESMVATREGKEVGSIIFQYRTRAAAERAWNELISLAAQCQRRVALDLSAEGISTRTVVLTEVSRTRALFGTSGLTFFYDFNVVIDAFGSKFAFVGDSYVSYYLAGTSITSVGFGSGTGTRGVGRVTRGFVDTMSIVVAQRVERRSLS